VELDNAEDAARFFGQYSEALETKHSLRTNLFRRPNFFQFQTDSGEVFLRCVETSCLTVEGATRNTYDKINKALGWPPAPQAPVATPPPPALTEQLTNGSVTLKLLASFHEGASSAALCKTNCLEKAPPN
jgi:hypothetical protein